MRLKEDSSNWKASNVLRKVTEIPEEVPRRMKKKDTNKWCKGKVGVKHKYELISESKFHRLTWSEYRCTVCRKKHLKSMVAIA